MPAIPRRLVILWLLLLPTQLLAADGPPVSANFKQANRYSRDYLSQFTYSTSVSPRWIGKTDRFWYSYRTSEGTRYWLVDPATATRTPLFDHERLAEDLSIATRKPIDVTGLSLSGAKIDDAGKILSFVVEKTKFELDLATGVLTDKGKADERSAARSNRFRSGEYQRRFREMTGRGAPPTGRRTHRNFAPDNTAYLFAMNHNLYYVEASDEIKTKIKEIDARRKREEEEKKKAGEDNKSQDEEKKEVKDDDSKETDDSKKKIEKDHQENTEQKTTDEKKTDDEKVQEETGKTDQEKLKQDQITDSEKDKQKNEKQDETGSQETAGEDKKEKDPGKETDERRLWANDIDESKALQLTTDGVEDYSFAGGRSYYGFRRQKEQEKTDDEKKKKEDETKKKTRPNVSWSEDSTSFYVTRRDRRGIAELYLVNSLSQPRPTLEKYKYPMPGEEDIKNTELYIFDRSKKSLSKVATHWNEESYLNLHWGKSGDELRMVRRDRPMRNIEFCSINTRTLEIKVLFTEGLIDANIATQSARYLEDRDEFIWWSERTGWGHFYLYGRDGVLKNPITRGGFRASRIVEVDEKKGLLYFRGNGREKGENIYYEHLYRVYLDGTGLTLLDPGNATHRSSLSPTKSYLVDNFSRVDAAPMSLLRDASGKAIMVLEKADLSRLYEAGWKMPETFTVKAADGVTDLYGNMWKPFDFDPSKRYPIIAEVYPGPQTEGVTHSFSAYSSRMQLAQVGFIVVQVGHRGGTPGRSKAYHSYGYHNLRDYGLEDKKAALEQLATRHPYIDIERVGIYGHSGGGFMTAAALLRKPYNKFFKVGVASSGNHDNNIYNADWAERYHGLEEEAVEKQKTEEQKDQKDQKDQKQDQNQKTTEDQVKDKDQEKDKEKEKEQQHKTEQEARVKYKIEVPTNAELAANLEGHLLLVHGEIDNNVHPAGTMRLVDALIKANKRFDMLIIPGKRHGYGDAQAYFSQVRREYFARHLLGARFDGADIFETE